MIKLKGVVVGSIVRYKCKRKEECGKVYYVYTGKKKKVGVVAGNGKLSAVPIENCELVGIRSGENFYSASPKKCFAGGRK